jgi:hypothetical protein
MEGNKMKEYLIRIESNHTSECTTINGDNYRPFMIAHNLWNYTTPWHAAQRLEKLAKCWEALGNDVKRVNGSVWDMPTTGNKKNINLILLDYEWIE